MQKILVALSALSLGLASCSTNNVTEDDSIKKYFDEQNVIGTFGQFDNTRGEFTIYNLARFADTAFLPAQTFDVVNAMIALETGEVQNDSAVLIMSHDKPREPVEPMDSVSRCEDLPMYAAFRANCLPFFSAARIRNRQGKNAILAGFIRLWPA